MRKIIFYIVFPAFLPVSVSLCAEPAGNLGDLCKTVVTHIPDADVAYNGGYDVRGNKVAGADLPNENSVELPTEYSFPVTSDQISDLNLGGMLDGKMPIGVITVRGNNVYFNDRQIDGIGPDNLRVLCLKNPNK